MYGGRGNSGQCSVEVAEALEALVLLVGCPSTFLMTCVMVWPIYLGAIIPKKLTHDYNYLWLRWSEAWRWCDDASSAFAAHTTVNTRETSETYPKPASARGPKMRGTTREACVEGQAAKSTTVTWHWTVWKQLVVLAIAPWTLICILFVFFKCIIFVLIELWHSCTLYQESHACP